MIEVWKGIKGFPNYQISNLGKVKSKPREKTKGGILKECISNTGYVYVNLYKDGKLYRKTIHRLVMDNFYEVNHKDGNKKNNSINNLEYVTKSENIKHRFNILKQEPYKKYKKENYDYNTKEGINKYARDYYQRNKTRILEYGRKWRKNKKTKEQYKSVEYIVKE